MAIVQCMKFYKEIQNKSCQEKKKYRMQISTIINSNTVVISMTLTAISPSHLDTVDLK